ncbi:MAG: hypothetical protein KGJ84_00725 [Elusimicrobia bacterium]|nr:hypothetical protein [Elusimicrobiota bacterium]
MVFQLLTALLLCARPAGAAAPGPAPDRPLAVVAGADFPAAKLTVAQARRIYLGKMLFIKEVRLKPMEPKDDALKAVFLARLMNMTSQKFKLHWLSNLFREGLEPPESVSPAQLLSALREDPGRLGFMWLEDARSESGLRILLVVGTP